MFDMSGLTASLCYRTNGLKAFFFKVSSGLIGVTRHGGGGGGIEDSTATLVSYGALITGGRRRDFHLARNSGELRGLLYPRYGEGIYSTGVKGQARHQTESSICPTC